MVKNFRKRQSYENILTLKFLKRKFPTTEISRTTVSHIPWALPGKSVGKLQELIRRWVQSNSATSNQWVMLIDAVVMCDEPAVAQELATAVGCPLARSGTTTQHV